MEPTGNHGSGFSPGPGVSPGPETSGSKSPALVSGLVKSLRSSIRRNKKETHSPHSASSLKAMFRVDSPSPKSRGLSRSNTDPNLGSLKHRGAHLRRSLFGTKRERGEVMSSVMSSVKEGGGGEEGRSEEEERGDEEEAQPDEMYCLPELPPIPLSVMQIHKLIEMEVLEEAYLNLLALRVEFQRDTSMKTTVSLSPEAKTTVSLSPEAKTTVSLSPEAKTPVSPSPEAKTPVSPSPESVVLVKKEKDLNLLYNELKTKVHGIVRDSNSLPARNKPLLHMVCRIIQEEEQRVLEPGGLGCSWRTMWRSAVGEGVQARVDQVTMETPQQNPAWLATHLGLLGRTVVTDLKGVKTDLRWAYPPSFMVFHEYVSSYNRVVGKHLQKLMKETSDLKDLYHLLTWSQVHYNSEAVMQHVSLQPEISLESTELDLDPDFKTELRTKYCNRVQEDLRSSLSNITELEDKEFWSKAKEPESEDGLWLSDIHMDIGTLVKGLVTRSEKIDPDLELRVTSCCLSELTDFPRRFEVDFRRQCEGLKPQLWKQYLVTYVNSFSTLLEHMESLGQTCPAQLQALTKQTDSFRERLLHELTLLYSNSIQVPLRRMMSRKWLTTDEDFRDLRTKTEELSVLCGGLRKPHAEEVASSQHLLLSRLLLSRLMKGQFSCKNRKHQRAAERLRKQWDLLQELFKSMGSWHLWLCPVGGAVCDLIGQKHEDHIKDQLPALIQLCPDFGRRHLVALLWFRGLPRGREHGQILKTLSELKKKNSGAIQENPFLFKDMEVTTNQNCLLPYSCVCGDWDQD